MDYHIAVIGGGAAGLMAACAPGGGKTALVEKNHRTGKKILATGGGRCNLTNINADKDFYLSSDMETAEKMLNSFSVDEILDFFLGMGLMHRIEEGRVYPYTNQAGAVLDCLRKRASLLDTVEITDYEVTEIRKKSKGFVVVSQSGEKIGAEKVIVATGGLAGLKDGERGGYNLLEMMGHSINKLFPTLVPLKIKGNLCKGFAGIRVKGAVRAVHKGNVLMEEEGEILFTDYGLSGIAVMQLSGLYHRYRPMNLELDFFPAYSRKELTEILFKRRDLAPAADYLTGSVNKKIAAYLMNEAGINKAAPSADIEPEKIKALAHSLKHMEFEVQDSAGFSKAQVTQGGASLREFNTKTLESRIVPGLYAAGEVLDIWGMCGGFNLHWAWVSGLLAGMSAKGEVDATHK